MVKRACRGEANIVRYVDDNICFFQNKDDTERFYNMLIKRLTKFQLQVAEDKTKILEFGALPKKTGKKRDKESRRRLFLGFTHYCSKSSKGKFREKENKQEEV